MSKNRLVNRSWPYSAIIAGRAANATWFFGDGAIYTNYAANSYHMWTNGGDYTITCTVVNADNAAGVCSGVCNFWPQLNCNRIGS